MKPTPETADPNGFRRSKRQTSFPMRYKLHSWSPHSVVNVLRKTFAVVSLLAISLLALLVIGGRIHHDPSRGTTADIITSWVIFAVFVPLFARRQIKALTDGCSESRRAAWLRGWSRAVIGFAETLGKLMCGIDAPYLFLVSSQLRANRLADELDRAADRLTRKLAEVGRTLEAFVNKHVTAVGLALPVATAVCYLSTRLWPGPSPVTLVTVLAAVVGGAWLSASLALTDALKIPERIAAGTISSRASGACFTVFIMGPAAAVIALTLQRP